MISEPRISEGTVMKILSKQIVVLSSLLFVVSGVLAFSAQAQTPLFGTTSINIQFNHCSTPPRCIPDNNDLGNVSVTVNGFTAQYTYTGSPGIAGIAQGLANTFNGNSNSPVTASASGGIVTLTAKQGGPAGNYTFSTSAHDKNPSGVSPQYVPNPTSGILTGGGEQGYLNPKYVVVGVIYAPPGSKSSVNYTKSTLVSNTSSISQTFSNSVTKSISVTTPGGIFGFLGGSRTNTQSSTVTQQSQNSSSVTATFATSQGITVPGPASDYVGVDHDYDIIEVWINPVMLFSVIYSGTSTVSVIQWDGYGSSSLDTVAPVDIVQIPVGCLNGDFSPTISSCSAPLGAFQRTWAASENWPSGQGPGLTSADLNNILAADPFGNCTPTLPVGASACPVPTSQFTIPPQFNIAFINGVSTDFQYTQPLPGGQPTTTTYSLTTTNSATQGQGSTNTYSQTFGFEDSFTGTSFLSGISAKVSQSRTLMWTYQQNDQITSTSTSSATAIITGPACNGNPCNPSYPPNSLTYGSATFFDVYQDNFFGTFLFVPVRYN